MIEGWIKSVQKKECEGVILSGDISNSKNVEKTLLDVAEALQMPIYFVRGNHDFYGSSHELMNQKVGQLCKSHPFLKFLDQEKMIELNSTTAIVGHSGWADGTAGAGNKSTVSLNDFFHINELVNLDISSRSKVIQKWAGKAANHFRKILPAAVEKYQNILIVTHVPPFVEACWHRGKLSDEEYLPHFSSPSVGVPIKEIAKKNPGRNFTVLCGHTHGEGAATILPNLTVYTGGAEYGTPRINGVMEI